MYPSTGTLFPSVAVTIIFPVELTVVGSNFIDKLSNTPGSNVTPPEASVAEVSDPMLAANDEVVSAGDGFEIPLSPTITDWMYASLGIAPVMVIFLLVVLTEHV